MLTKLKKNSKILLILISVFIIVFFSYDFLIDKKTREDIKFWIDDNINYKVDVITNVIQRSKNYSNRYYNDYNEEFLPETQSNRLKLELKKFNFIRTFQIDFIKNNPEGNNLLSFFIEFFDKDKLIIIDSRSNIFVVDELAEKSRFEIDDVIHIKSNLNSEVDRVLDSHFHKNKLFISFESREKNNCKNFKIYVADFNFQNIDFKPFYEDLSCKKILNSGRMKSFMFNDKEGLLFGSSAAIYDKPTNDPQDDTSRFGKILFQEFTSNNITTFSKGHRLILGLHVENELILSTENGPRGGDEINKIVYGGNYGWPISSYGRRYDSDYEDNPLNYKNEHDRYGYQEPIFSFIPSIGISEIIKIPNNFLKNWIDNFLIASLNKRALFRTKFNNEKNKILFYEEIYIGSRIRDLKYHQELNGVLLALEDRAELGILKEYKN